VRRAILRWLLRGYAMPQTTDTEEHRAELIRRIPHVTSDVLAAWIVVESHDPVTVAALIAALNERHGHDLVMAHVADAQRDFARGYVEPVRQPPEDISTQDMPQQLFNPYENEE
jgi:hypothetical protein